MVLELNESIYILDMLISHASRPCRTKNEIYSDLKKMSDVTDVIKKLLRG